MHWIAIAAMARNRVIGNGGRIPWHISDEFRWFKKRTMGGVLVMGRKTYESIGRPLPGRETVVITRSGQTYEGTGSVAGWDELRERDFGGREVFIAGGAEIYAQTLPACGELLLTVVGMEPEGDAYFPVFEDAFVLDESVMEHPEFTVFRYLRREKQGPISMGETF